MIQLKISGKDKLKTKEHSSRLGDLCATLKKTKPSFYGAVEIMGPIEASLTKIAEQFRWQILLKSRNAKALHQFVGQLLAENPNVFNHRRVRVVIDVDPITIM